MVGRLCREVKLSGLRLELAHLRDAPAWEGWLSPAELRQAAGVRVPVQRARHVISRGMRRKFLSEALGCDHAALQFAEAEGAKPRLSAGGRCDFNVSHAGDYVAFVAGRGEVGVDLEKIRPVREMAALVQRYFHADEATAWRALADELRQDAFFVLWSAREAAMKCAGTGLARGLALTRVDPSILHSDRATAVVGVRNMLLRKEPAPPAYVLVTARSLS